MEETEEKIKSVTDDELIQSLTESSESEEGLAEDEGNWIGMEKDNIISVDGFEMIEPPTDLTDKQEQSNDKVTKPPAVNKEHVSSNLAHHLKTETQSKAAVTDQQTDPIRKSKPTERVILEDTGKRTEHVVKLSFELDKTPTDSKVNWGTDRPDKTNTKTTSSKSDGDDHSPTPDKIGLSPDKSSYFSI